MKYIELTKGKQAIVDDELFDELSAFNWYYDSRGYATRVLRVNGKPKYIGMHRVVNATPEGLMTDHKNQNRLDNRRENLRTCTRSENSCNSVRTPSSGYKGVYKTKTKFEARLQKNGVIHYLGNFDTAEQASEAYREAAVKYHGEFAYM